MNKRILAALIGALFGAPMVAQAQPKKLRRLRFRDATAIPFRMNAGIEGDPNRFHPTSIEPCKIDAAAPPLFYGVPVIADATTNGVRAISAADQSDATDLVPWGFTVRPFPVQQQSSGMTSSFGSGTPPASSEIDVMRSGYIMSFLPAGGAVHKGDPVYVWAAASSGAHVQGKLEAAASAGNTVKLKTGVYYFNGPADAAGNVEVCVNV